MAGMRLPGQPRRGARALRRVDWLALAYVPAAVTLARVRRKIGIPGSIALAVAYGAPFAMRRALPAGRSRMCGVWLAHMWAYKVAFEVPYDRPEKLRRRLRVDEPIRADTAIGFGLPPGQRLQRRLRNPPTLTTLDKALTFIYLLWEPEPHAALAWIMWRHPGRVLGAAARMAATFDSTLLGYYLIPTAPPWWASEEEGRMEGEVRRVTLEVIRWLRGQRRPEDDHNPGGNPWASMPSDHFASATSAAIALWEADHRAGAIGGAYALALAVALVYTGEHYVIDLVMGLALALTIHAVGHMATGPLVRAAEVMFGPGPAHRRLAR